MDKFIFPEKFIVLDYEANCDVPIILGRPFSKTRRTLAEVHKGTIILRMNDQPIELNVNDTLKCLATAEECSPIYKLTKKKSNK